MNGGRESQIFYFINIPNKPLKDLTHLTHLILHTLEHCFHLQPGHAKGPQIWHWPRTGKGPAAVQTRYKRSCHLVLKMQLVMIAWVGIVGKYDEWTFITPPRETHSSSLWSSGKRQYHSQWRSAHFLKNISLVLLDLGRRWKSSHGTPCDHECGTDHEFSIDWVLNGAGQAQHMMHDECSVSVPEHEQDQRTQASISGSHVIHHCSTRTDLGQPTLAALWESPYNQRTEGKKKQLSLWMVWLGMWVSDKNRLQLQASFTQGWPQHRVVEENLLNGQSFEQYNGSYVLCGKRNNLGWDYMEIHEQWPMDHLDWSSGQGPE